MCNEWEGIWFNFSGALEFLILNHRYVDDIIDAAVVSVKAGVNLELHASQFGTGVFDWLKDAVEEGQVTEVSIEYSPTCSTVWI